MVGQGVLRECLLDPEVHAVLSVGRTATGQAHAKLRELVHRDFLDFSAIETELRGFNACLFCLGVSSVGMTEDAYRRVTFDITLAAAQTLARLNPTMTFIYISGAGTDSSELGRRMWARVKGQTDHGIHVGKQYATLDGDLRGPRTSGFQGGCSRCRAVGRLLNANRA
jgi:hypothetical protein